MEKRRCLIGPNRSVAVHCSSPCWPRQSRAAWPFFLGFTYRKNKAEAEIGSAEQEAKRIVSDAIKSAEARKKEIVLEGKDELHRLRDESEKELNNRRKEIQHQDGASSKRRRAWRKSWNPWSARKTKSTRRTRRQRSA